MDYTVKQVIDRVINLDISNPPIFGDLISPFYFKDQSSALVIQSDGVYLLAPEDYDSLFIRDLYLRLTELLSVFEMLQKRNSILILPCEPGHISLFYEQKNQFNTYASNVFKISDSSKLVLQNDNIKIVDSGARCLVSRYELSKINLNLTKMLNAVVLPTSGLKRFKDNDYMHDDMFINVQSLKISQISIIVAIILAILTPFFTSLFSVVDSINTQYYRNCPYFEFEDDLKTDAFHE